MSDFNSVSLVGGPVLDGSVDLHRAEKDDGEHPFRLKIAYLMQNAGNPLEEDVGPAVLIKHKLRGLAAHGHRVHVYRLLGRTVVCFEDLDTLERISLPAMGLSGTTIFRVGESAVRRVQRELRLPYLAWFDAFRFYEAAVRILPKYDLCHEYGGLFSLSAALACRQLGIPHILTVEADPFLENDVKGTPIRGLRRAVAAAEARLAYGLADRILTVSNAARNHFVENWGVDEDKIVVMPNGVDLQKFHPNYDASPIREQYRLGNGLVVGFVGGFQKWHGIEDLVGAFAKIAAERAEARLLLVGDGPSRASVQALCHELGIADAVVFPGLVPQDRIPAFLAAVDVAVIPYPRLPKEMWFSPLKLFEYMAAGKPIVASRDGQIAEILVHEHTGLLVEPGDQAAFAAAIKQLFQRPQDRQRLGAEARREAEQNHSWENYTTRLEEVYREVLHERISP